MHLDKKLVGIIIGTLFVGIVLGGMIVSFSIHRSDRGMPHVRGNMVERGGFQGGGRVNTDIRGGVAPLE